MKNLKRIMAATLALTVLFATSVMAAQTPREILSQAYANSMDATTMSVTGNIAGTVNMMGVELLRLNIDIRMDMDVDLDAGTMMMYMRMPMQITGADPLTGESMDENVEVAVFMDGTTVFVYESTIGWFTDPSMEVGDLDDMFAGMNLDELIAWSMELNEQIMDEITIRFADDQVPGYYVIEQFMDLDDIMNMLDAMLTPEFFDSLLAFIPEEDLAGIDQAEWDMVMGELDGMMDELLAMLDELDIEIELEIVYRSYIDVETLTFSNYNMHMVLAFAADLDLGILGELEISGNFTMDLYIDYNPTIVWPVIDEVVGLDEVMDALGIFHEEMIFSAADLEDRVAMMFDDANIVVLEIAIDADAAFNVFFVNHGNEAVTLVLYGIVDTVIQPGQNFVMQIPAGDADDVLIVLEGGDAPVNVEAGFRLTNVPLFN